jgi:DNA-binding transcriptional ArsR family regulator
MASYLDARGAMSIDSHMANLDSIFHGLSDPTRRAVIARLAAGPAAVSELAAPHGMALPSFLKHLKVLEASGWIASDKAGRVRTCRLQPETVKAAEGWLGQQRSLWEARLDRLDAFLDNLNDEGKNDEG